MLLNSNPVIRTICEDVPAFSLGHTQCHEHIWLEKGSSRGFNPALIIDDYDKSLKELKDYAKIGGSAIVDAQPGGFGRNGVVLKRLSQNSSIKIIAVTGFHKLIYLDRQASFLDKNVDELIEHFVFEIECCLLECCSTGKKKDKTSDPIKAGIIKIALEPETFNNPVYKKLIQAAAEGAAIAGSPVLVHTEPGSDVLGLIRYFETKNVNPNRLIICHLDRTCRVRDYHKEVLDAGCYLCYDSIYREKYISLEEETNLILWICDMGHEEQLLLSLDTTNERLRAYSGCSMGLDYILAHFVPRLKNSGVLDRQIQYMCVDNPRKALRLSK